jgi:UDP-N-acetyl-alpha-D-muramoyl-L-alanyl-L-glutamate epimerase
MFTIHAPTLAAANSAVFRYTCATYGAFEERVTWPEPHIEQSEAQDSGPKKKLSPESPKDLSTQPALLNLMAALLGVSYYKAAAASGIMVEVPLGPASRAAIMACYTEGLGEFLFRNALPYPPKLNWHWSDAAPAAASEQPASTHAIMAFGGGKDSHAAMSLINSALMNEPRLTYEPVSIILDDKVGDRLARMIGEPLTFIHRQIAPEIIRLAREKTGYNGHVPITAINSAILTTYAALKGAGAVIFANERGASKPTIMHHGHAINHQYSKSIAFEGLMRAALEECAGTSPQWFSLLRPFSELWIAREVATHAKAAHGKFTSCNRNFVFAGTKVLAGGERWCGTCPKCVFTAAIFAPHCDAPQMDTIFGKDILGNETNVQMARDLAGLGTMKPWECVGDAEDTAAALAMLADHPVWQHKAVVKALTPELNDRYNLESLRARFAGEMVARGPHFVPQPWARLIDSAD